jgi:hypothetical protein
MINLLIRCPKKRINTSLFVLLSAKKHYEEKLLFTLIRRPLSFEFYLQVNKYIATGKQFMKAKQRYVSFKNLMKVE